MFKVNFTATVVNPDTEDNFNGWVDPSYSMFLLFEDAPTPKEFDTLKESEEYIDSEIGSVEAPERGIYYAQDSKMNYESGESWSYAAVVHED